ncbi:MAG: hypothetical protein ACPLVI_00725 [Thermoplasmata archaeon]
MRGDDRASIGIKRGTKEILNKISSEIVHELERADLTWDDVVIYLSYIYEKSNNRVMSHIIRFEDYYSKEDIEKIRKKLKIL